MPAAMSQDEPRIDEEVVILIAEGEVSQEAVEKALARQETRIGKLAVELGLLKPPQVLEILRIQRSRGFRFGELCVRKGWLRPEQVSHLLGLQEKRARPLLDRLVASGDVSPEAAARVRNRA